MIQWTYRRGHWSSYDPADDSYSLAAQDRLRKWDLQRRWSKFASLGPIPEKWTDVGPAPTGIAFIGEVMKAYYIGPVRQVMNNASPLLRLLDAR